MRFTSHYIASRPLALRATFLGLGTFLPRSLCAVGPGTHCACRCCWSHVRSCFALCCGPWLLVPLSGIRSLLLRSLLLQRLVPLCRGLGQQSFLQRSVRPIGAPVAAYVCLSSIRCFVIDIFVIFQPMADSCFIYTFINAKKM